MIDGDCRRKISDQEKVDIYRRKMAGETLADLAFDFRCSESSIHRIVHWIRRVKEAEIRGIEEK